MSFLRRFPFYEPDHIGDESHLIHDCPILSTLRNKLGADLKLALTNKDYSNIFNDLKLSTELGKFIFEAFETRNNWLKSQQDLPDVGHTHDN